MKPIFLLTLFLFFINLCWGQEENNKISKLLEDYKIKSSLGIQLWTTYTVNGALYDENIKSYVPVDDRLNSQIRRARFGLSAEPYENLKFKFTLAFDLVGRDILSGTEGGANNGPSPFFRLWNAWVQWKMTDKNDLFHLTGGYFVPIIGRASITGALRSTAMEKAWSQNYLRRHLFGVGPGRIVGINLGGLKISEGAKVAFGYDLSITNPLFQNFAANSNGVQASPLLTGRIVAYFGDPEQKNYSMSHQSNYFGQRKGLSIAIAAAQQGETDLFNKNEALSADLLFNWGPLNLDGEWSMIKRSGSIGDTTLDALAKTGYIRMSYNIELANKRYLEPVFMLVQFNGEEEAAKQAHATALGTDSGTHQIWDLGMNYYFNPDLRLSLHFIANTGDLGAAAIGSSINNYFSQSGLAIQRGDWMGLEFIAIF